MFSIEITAQQRVQLEGLVAVQTGKAGELRIYFNLLEKLQTPAAYKRSLIDKLPNGLEVWNEAALAVAETVELALEQEEADRLRDLLEKWDRFTVVDMRWVKPLRAALDGLIASR